MTLIARTTKAVMAKPLLLLYFKEIMPKTALATNKNNQTMKSKEKKKLVKS
jgi:hypothetical protein